MASRGPTQDDIDNYHRLCVEFVGIHPSVVSESFKQFGFDYEKTRCILRGKLESTEEDDDQFEDLLDDSFDQEDRDAYASDDSSVELPADYLTQQYIFFGKVCDDPKDPKSSRHIMPDELEIVESSTLRQVLPGTEYLCRDWLQSGFCEDKECPFLHSLYGVSCKKEAACQDDCCPFVHTTITQQILKVREKLGLELRRPDEPTSKYDRAAWEAFEKVKCPSLDQLKAAFPGEQIPEDFADVALCVWPEGEEDQKVVQAIEKADKSAGERILIGTDTIDDKTISYFGLERLWSSKIPFLDMFRAYNNEIEIHGRMRMFHIDAAVKCKGDEAKEHLRLARIHYDRERFLTRGSDSYFLNMSNPYYASFSDSNERVLYLYGLTVTETREILNQLFNGTKRQQLKFFVFAMQSREQYFHFVTLEDIRKYCQAKGIVVTDHGDVLEFLY